MLRSGQVFGDYVVERELGAGGFATVYLAQHQRTRQTVALKILRPDATSGYDPITRGRFQREVAIVGELQNRHTVRLIATGETDGLLWASFEHILGRDLSELLGEEKRLPAGTVRLILRQLLSALAEAHSHGLIHRDIKPQNIRVVYEADGRFSVKLLDFGIARGTDAAHPSVTKTGELIGTPRYMSPEQLRGEPLSAASDVFSVGLIGFEMLAGRDALHGNMLAEQVERMLPDHEFLLESPSLDDERMMRVLQRMLISDVRKRISNASLALRAMDAPRVHVEEQSLPDGHSIAKLVGVTAVIVVLLASVFVLSRPKEAPAESEVLPPPKRENPLSVESQEQVRGLRDVQPIITDPLCATGPYRGSRGPASLGPRRDVYHYVPESFAPQDSPGLLMLLRNGGGATASGFLDYSGMVEVADRENLLVIVPEPTVAFRTWGTMAVTGAWSDLRYLREAYCVAEDAPVFLLGDGLGAAGVDRVLGKFGDRVTAAAVATLRYEGETEAVQSVPYLDFTHQDDHGAPYEGGKNSTGDGPFFSAAERFERLRAWNGCSGARRDVLYPGCHAWTCQKELVICDLPGGRLWQTKSQLEEDAEKVAGFSVEVPHTEIVWAFFQSVRDGTSMQPASIPKRVVPDP